MIGIPAFRILIQDIYTGDIKVELETDDYNLLKEWLDLNGFFWNGKQCDYTDGTGRLAIPQTYSGFTNIKGEL